MLSVQPVIRCRLTFEKCGPSYFGAGCGPSYCEAGRAAGYDVATFTGRADCRPSYCGADCGPGDDQGGAACGLDCNMRGVLRAQISRPRRVLIDTCVYSILHIHRTSPEACT